MIKGNEDEGDDEEQESIRKKTVSSMFIKSENFTKSYSKVIHIANLNEDPILSKKIAFNLEKQNVVKVGREKWDESLKNNIVINGVGIHEDHALVVYNPED